MIFHNLYECFDEITHNGNIQIIVAIAGLLKPSVLKYFSKIIKRHLDKLGVAKILHIHKT
jgi:hypothetical protein